MPTMRQMYESGMTVEEIAAERGVPRHRVRSCLRRAGVKGVPGPLTLRRMHESGMTVEEIATERGIPPKSVRAQLRAQGVDIPAAASGSRTGGPTLRQQYESGMTVEEIAAERGARPSIVAADLRRIGMDIPRQRRAKAEPRPSSRKRPTLRQQYESGMTVEEIAAERGQKPKNIRLRLREQGVDIPKLVSTRDLLRSGMTVEEVAKETGATLAAVQRAAQRLSPPPPRQPLLTGDQWERATVLLDDGVPARWVAEDYGVKPETLAKHYRKRVGHHLPSHGQFARVWARIRQNPELLAMHREFAPK